MARLVTLQEVKQGEVDTDDLLKLNALLDMRETMQLQAQLENQT
ncbi:Uncharacterised protein [Pragia fontium]|uniref:Uncharacterized protein n=1 Tax=Pragia fontium DSM 5563 = ATCC 49100 TaxID=1122977 RepID=A0AAJ4W7F3_9GAMM|nr:hypothetical protein SAMN02745723_10167 [Pragia fontium DSM 5563 = ATCC 49100]SUB81743.1 Uncharacterised protein [Pragia fontium]VEJ54283.1 Uncharacterised protein [Pragia fontium]